MIKSKLFLLLLLSFFIGTCGVRASVETEIVISGTIKGLEEDVPIKVYSFEKSETLTESKLSESGSFELKFPANSGVYRLIFGKYNKEKSLEIIVTGNEKRIDFVLDLKSQSIKPEFSNSKENQDWYDYKSLENRHIYKQKLIHQFIGYYPDKSDKLYQAAQKGLFKARSDFQKDREDFINAHPGYAGEMVRNLPVWLPLDPTTDKISQNKEHIRDYWKQPIKDDDTSLLNTPLYVHHTVSYLDLFMRSYGQKEGEQKIKDAIDFLMKKFGKNYEIRKQVVLTLVGKLKNSTVLEPLLQHVDENYLDATMLSGEEELKEYAIRLATYRDLKRGEVPPLVYYMEGDRKIPFTEIKSEYLFLVFWESTCSHCKEQMPKFNEFLKGNTKYKALAISMDESEYSYKKFLPKIDQMYKYCDFKGGEGEPFQKYYVTSTPTFYLLDKNKRLIRKYSSIEAIEYDVKENNI